MEKKVQEGKEGKVREGRGKGREEKERGRKVDEFFFEIFLLLERYISYKI